MGQNFFTDNDDLQYYVERGIDWNALVRALERDFSDPDGPRSFAEAVETYRDTLDAVGGFVAEEIAPRAAQVDREGVRLRDGEVVHSEPLEHIFREISKMGFHGLTVPRELGGMNAPLLTYFVSTELMARGDVSPLAHISFHGGIAMALLLFSIREGTTVLEKGTGKVLETRFRDAIEEIVTGSAWGSMDITESHAGSDMAQLRTVGVQDPEGNWILRGAKIFITSGHGKYHLVIARTEEATESDNPMAGLAGLSMFLVPAYEQLPDGTRKRFVTIDRVEEKLGHHGSPTCSLNFEGSPAHLIGKRGEGFRYMLTLMNNARIGVGFECVGLCEAAYRQARDYARERHSMGKTIDRHEMIADYFEEMRTDIQGLRALAMHAAFHEEMTHRLEVCAASGETEFGGRDIEKTIASHRRKSRRATPLLKYLAAEKSVEISRRALQIHGGNGFITEYPAEKLLRDSLVMPLYEGTSQIQSLMAMKDTLNAILRNPQGFVVRTAKAQWRSVSARDDLERRVGKLQLLSFRAQQYLLARTAGGKFRRVVDQPITRWPKSFFRDWDPKRDFAFAMLHAERLTRLLADVLISEVLLAQAKVHADRREVLERYLDRAEPRCRFLVDEITSTGTRLLRSLDPMQAEAAE